MNKMDSYYIHNEINAFLLYLGDNWTATETDTSGKNKPQTANRNEFATTTHAALNATKNFHHEREILNIKISQDGTSAQVESKETEGGIIQRKSVTMQEHSIDQLELQNNNLIISKSTMTMAVKQ
jgi:hypothetical protein